MIRRSTLVLALSLAASTANLTCCPTCIGGLEQTTPPYFSDEYDTYLENQYEGKPNPSTPPSTTPQENFQKKVKRPS